MYDNFWCFWVALVVMIFTMCTIACSRTAAKSVPTNYILLLVFTLSESFMVAFICTFYNPETVMIAACLTMAMFFGLTLYAFTTKDDFTICGGMLWAACITLIFMGIFMGSMPGSG